RVVRGRTAPASRRTVAVGRLPAHVGEHQHLRGNDGVGPCRGVPDTFRPPLSRLRRGLKVPLPQPEARTAACSGRPAGYLEIRDRTAASSSPRLGSLLVGLGGVYPGLRRLQEWMPYVSGRRSREPGGRVWPQARAARLTSTDDAEEGTRTPGLRAWLSRLEVVRTSQPSAIFCGNPRPAERQSRATFA